MATIYSMFDEWLTARRTLAKEYGGPFRTALGYFVSIFHRPISLKLHYLRIRKRLDNCCDLEPGYFVECTESQLEETFQDPNVCLIEQNSHGIFC